MATIRNETSADITGIHAVNAAAFRFIGHLPGNLNTDDAPQTDCGGNRLPGKITAMSKYRNRANAAIRMCRRSALSAHGATDIGITGNQQDDPAITTTPLIGVVASNRLEPTVTDCGQSFGLNALHR